MPPPSTHTNLTITAQQRDALYDYILDRLSGIGDIWLAVCAENYDTAKRLGREYSDELCLLLDDLGWDEGIGGTVELTTRPDTLRRVFSRLRNSAASLVNSEEKERAEAQEFEERNRLVAEACQHVLAYLEGKPS